ncbi:hypothetical protein [Serratia bockelmannii]|uniref:hypothetical protein n=1 Tax=Serratia bockelmannii TaxID=2703793 RepID=UPI002361BF86|nr:hypothetical protein [Serratia bockelmannii]
MTGGLYVFVYLLGLMIAPWVLVVTLIGVLSCAGMVAARWRFCRRGVRPDWLAPLLLMVLGTSMLMLPGWRLIDALINETDVTLPAFRKDTMFELMGVNGPVGMAVTAACCCLLTFFLAPRRLAMGWKKNWRRRFLSGELALSGTVWGLLVTGGVWWFMALQVVIHGP